MRVLFCGDVVGRAGRRAVVKHVPELRRRLALDFVAVNGENAAHGFGITAKICKEFYAAGVDAITTGNHVWAQREIMTYIADDPRLLRPLNLAPHTPGLGAAVYDSPGGRKVLVIHPIGRLYMAPAEDPFAAVEDQLARHRLGETVGCILVDVHAEATSEKMAMGQHLDGRVSMVVGSHSHVPTADCQILPGGTAYQTDMGMCGDYDSVIGMEKKTAVARFLDGRKDQRLEPATGEATLCAVYLETDDRTGLARSTEPVRLGGRLAQTRPE